MARIRNDGWKDDLLLKEALQNYIKIGLTRNEILDFIQRDFGQYAWSLRTLDRRLQHFEIRSNDYTVSVEQVRDAVRQELQGPGRLLDYRAMHKKIRQVHDLAVPRDLVHDVMFELDPHGLEDRAPGFKAKKKKGNFTSPGPNFVHSCDGHDKLMGFQNSTFPIAVYGSLDTCSRKVMWMRAWMHNSDPKLIGRFYLEFLYEQRTMASILRVDKGTETGVLATMHAYLRQQHGDMDPEETILFGPSTSNQVKFAINSAFVSSPVLQDLSFHPPSLQIVPFAVSTLNKIKHSLTCSSNHIDMKTISCIKIHGNFHCKLDRTVVERTSSKDGKIL